MRRVRAVGVVVILLAASLTVVLAGPAAGTTLSVANEAEYRDAVTTLSSDSSEPHIIEITADITLDDGTDPTYTGTEPLTLAGNGHTIDAGGAHVHRLTEVRPEGHQRWGGRACTRQQVASARRWRGGALVRREPWATFASRRGGDRSATR